MSGHSHAKTIKHQKGLADAKRSAAFSKMAKELEIAAKDGGDPVFNSKLRMAIERARGVNMPAENIERAIKRGTGELEGGKLEEISLEAYGPGGIAIIIEGITDNKNRALSEIKQIINQNGGKLVGEGAVRWLFERKGVITVAAEQPDNISRDALELKAIEAGADDVEWSGAGAEGEVYLDIYTKTDEAEKVRKKLAGFGVKTESTTLDWVAKERVALPDDARKQAERLFAALDENDAVQEIYSNLAD